MDEVGPSMRSIASLGDLEVKSMLVKEGWKFFSLEGMLVKVNSPRKCWQQSASWRLPRGSGRRPLSL